MTKLKTARFGGMVSVLLFSASSFAGSYTITVPGHADRPMAWSFQNDTVGNAFPSPPDGTQIFTWDVANQSWQSTMYDTLIGGWTDPNRVLANGTGFFYRNGDAYPVNVTVSGTDVTASSVTFNYTAGNMYFLGMAYLHTDYNNFLECVFTPSGVRGYPTEHLNFSSNIGDIVHLWTYSADPAVPPFWKAGERFPDVSCGGDNGGPFWSYPDVGCGWVWSTYASPFVAPGEGFWYTPAQNTSWTHLPYTIDCPDEL